MSQSKETADSNSVEVDSASYVLTSFPLILQNIFEHLPARNLNGCACVCKIWKEISDRVIKVRSPFYWDFFTENAKETDNAGFSDPIFYMLTQIWKSIQIMPIQPKIVIIFMSQELALKIEDYGAQHLPGDISDLEWRLSNLNNIMKTCMYYSPPRQHYITNSRFKMNRFNLVEWFQNQMPFDCHVSEMVANGIIGTFWNSDDSCNSFGSAFSYFCCSQNDEKLSLIPVAVELYEDLQDEYYQDGRMKDLFNTNYEVKKIMVFEDYNFKTVYDVYDVAFALSEKYRQALVAGAAFEFPICESSGKKGACYIALCGENVKVASVVIENDSTTSQLEKYMAELKSHGLPEEKSIAFLFASDDLWGLFFWHLEEKKSTNFRKYFPQTPIFGTFVTHQIGFSFPKPVPDSSLNSDDDDQLRSKLHHETKCILCLVSFQ